MTKSITAAGVVLLAAMTLTLAACSDGSDVDSAKAQVQQAKQQLAEAKEQLADAKDQTDSTESDSADTAAEPEDTNTGGGDVAQTTGESATDSSWSGAQQAQVCANCGTISAIIPVQSSNGPPEFVGTIIGGAAGAAIGHQIGGGSGQDHRDHCGCDRWRNRRPQGSATHDGAQFIQGQSTDGCWRHAHDYRARRRAYCHGYASACEKRQYRPDVKPAGSIARGAERHQRETNGR